MTMKADEVDSIGNDRGAALVVVSSDAHVGPLVKDQLREYCERRYLEAFDDFVAQAQQASDAAEHVMADYAGDTDRERVQQLVWNSQTAGHHDVQARLADMDRDGVAAEVIFHGSQNGQLLPFEDVRKVIADVALSSAELEMVAVGKQIYNRWLADFCSVEPERHVGLAQVPMWDVERSTAEVGWAAEHGLRGVNFPAPNESMPAFEDPAWDPFFSTCADLNMPLTTHLGHGVRLKPDYVGPAAGGITFVEVPWVGRRAIWLLAFTGAFERHPNLKLVLTEVPGIWWSQTLRDMDDAYDNRYPSAATRQFLPKPPSEYARTNIFLGASFLSQAEAQAAVADGYADRVMWGSDYPHIEGTWRFPGPNERTPLTRLSLAHTFHDVPPPATRMMVGENALRCYQLDEDLLRGVAARISAPTLDELESPPDLSQIPADYHGFAFRGERAWS